MNQPPGRPVRPNPQLLAATQLVREVAREIESLLARAQAGTVRVRERRLRSWQARLQAAVTQLQQIPVIQIYPPPPIARQIDRAVRRIERAIATLAAIPVASPRIYPPQAGQAAVPVQTLQRVLNDLHEALQSLYRALGRA
jgi:hypothetical protein